MQQPGDPFRLLKVHVSVVLFADDCPEGSRRPGLSEGNAISQGSSKVGFMQSCHKMRKSVKHSTKVEKLICFT